MKGVKDDFLIIGLNSRGECSVIYRDGDGLQGTDFFFFYLIFEITEICLKGDLN